MGFKSVLKKIGEGALNVGASGLIPLPGVAQTAAQITKMIVDKDHPFPDALAAQDFIGQVDSIIQSVERIGAAAKMTGEQKKAAVVSEAMLIATQSFALAGRKIGDEALMQKAIDGTAQGVALIVQARVDFLNSLKAD